LSYFGASGEVGMEEKRVSYRGKESFINKAILHWEIERKKKGGGGRKEIIVRLWEGILNGVDMRKKGLARKRRRESTILSGQNQSFIWILREFGNQKNKTGGGRSPEAERAKGRKMVAKTPKALKRDFCVEKPHPPEAPGQEIRSGYKLQVEGRTRERTSVGRRKEKPWRGKRIQSSQASRFFCGFLVKKKTYLRGEADKKNARWGRGVPKRTQVQGGTWDAQI